MLDAQWEYNLANQPVILTPFLLMGAMSPVTIASALAQQLAEALTGIALAQLIRPGCPVIFGSFLSNIDMQSGSPCFGTPESAIGLLCTGQLARHYGLPFRTGGGLTSSQMPDAQAGYEALMTMLPTFLTGTNMVMHAAGWLESGLVSSYEKFVIDIELLRMLRVEFTPLEIDEAALAFDAHLEVGHGGHFLGAEHTMTRFRDCFYRPLVSNSQNFERWSREGANDAAARAGAIAQKTLDAYEEPADGRRDPRRARRVRDAASGRAGRLMRRPRRLAEPASAGPSKRPRRGAYDWRGFPRDEKMGTMSDSPTPRALRHRRRRHRRQLPRLPPGPARLARPDPGRQGPDAQPRAARRATRRTSSSRSTTPR